MNNLEKSGLEIVAKLMAVSARTAPKSGGIDHVQIMIADSKEQKSIANIMCKIGEEICNKLPNNKLGNAIRQDWESDAKTIAASGLLMLIGVEGRKIIGLNCGGCGFSTCSEMLKHPQVSIVENSFPGPYCIFKVMDLSIATTSAVKTAMEHNVDNRMMYKAGVAALKLGILNPCDLIIGIPLSATGKNIYFDRADKIDAWKIVKSNNV
ncbi:MAG: DUF2148 domain-containing protein [Candidatus Omnitrophica bacterium]|nr:DUF2148 domain-containing protein [Candidatus Omnitrophota bacterium]